MKYIIGVFLLWSVAVFSQVDSEFGILPKFNISSKINSKLKWVNSIEAREKIYDQDFLFEHVLLDLSTSVSYKTNLNERLNLGYILRFEEGEVIHRLFQQYNIIQQINTLKLGHRIGFEQHFPENEASFYRLRYRITAQKPLNGERVDENEFYIKVGNEYVWNISTEDIEARLSPYLGYKINKHNKLEIGTEYRISNVLDRLNKHRFWLRTTWYISL